MVPRRVLTDSPFDTLEKTFDLLVTGPNPLALDGTSFDGLADRAIPLGELKAMLLHPSMAFDDARRGGRRARRPFPFPWRRLDGRPRRGAPARASPGRLAARAGVSGQGRRHRGRDTRRVLGRRGPLRAGPSAPRVSVVLAGAHRRRPAAARRGGRARPAGHRPGLCRPTPTVGTPRPRAGAGRAGRGHRRGGRRADRHHPDR